MLSHIFSHYSDKLGIRYEALLAERGLQSCATAFRRLNGWCNINFANELFEFIRPMPSCAVLAMDVTDFFGSLDHAYLKTAWASVIQQDRLPADHFAVFKAITKYCQVELGALCDGFRTDLEGCTIDLESADDFGGVEKGVDHDEHSWTGIGSRCENECGSWRLLAADGYLELGLPSQAEDQRTTNEVWAVRCKIYRASKQWEAMHYVARHHVALDAE